MDAVSGLQAFESPDPAWWVDKGYAVIVFDIRGAFHSEGDNIHWGQAAAEDLYDAIEWSGTQPWSNGRVGMSGNSYLAILQYFVAPLRPPHLAAIAPWEGLFDIYRHNLAQGGIPNVQFFRDEIVTRFNGNGRVESLDRMLDEYPLMNSYWEDKRAKVEEIDIPAYFVASYSNPIHAQGTLQAFRAAKSKQKWLRVHHQQEWHDYYLPESLADLHRFFDRYLNGVENGWEGTPPVRMAILDLGGQDIRSVKSESWPPAGIVPTRLLLDAANQSLSDGPSTPAAVGYTFDEGGVSFTKAFSDETYIAGPIKLKIWLEVEGADDADIFVQVQKLSAKGDKLFHVTLPGKTGEMLAEGAKAGHAQTGFVFSGPQGRLRASLRKLDSGASSELEPYHRFDILEPLRPGEIVPLEIDIWPAALRFAAGEQLRVALSVRQFDDNSGADLPGGWSLPTKNEGKRIIHTGGEHDSHLLVPLWPRSQVEIARAA